MQKRHKYTKALLILFPAMLGIGFLMIIGLCSKPNVTIRFDMTIQQQIDSLLQQHTAGSKKCRSLYAGAQYHMGKSQVNNVYLTEQRMLESPDSLNTDALQKTAEQVNAFYQQNQTPICLIAAPCATEFYQDQLPEGVPYVSQKEQMELFYDALDTKIRTIDPYPILMPVQEDYIFYRTDAKWTCYGAYCVYRNAVQKMGFLPISYDSYVVSHVYGAYRGALYRSCYYSNVTPDILDVYYNEALDTEPIMRKGMDPDGQVLPLYDLDALLSDSPYNLYLGEACPLLTITTNLENGKGLLLLKDAWADCLVPFLTSHFQRIYILDVTCAAQQDAVSLDTVQFDQILMLCDLETYAETEIIQQVFQWIPEKEQLDD